MDKRLGPTILYLAVSHYVIQIFTRSSKSKSKGGVFRVMQSFLMNMFLLSFRCKGAIARLIENSASICVKVS